MINDGHGHEAGDTVLKQFAAVCQSRLRPQDYLGRMGGEEFLLLLLETRLNDAVRTFGRIRTEFPPATLNGGCDLPYTFSAGITDALTQDDCISILGRADRALYTAKRDGRNRTRLASMWNFEAIPLGGRPWGSRSYTSSIAFHTDPRWLDRCQQSVCRLQPAASPGLRWPADHPSKDVQSSENGWNGERGSRIGKEAVLLAARNIGNPTARSRVDHSSVAATIEPHLSAEWGTKAQHSLEQCRLAPRPGLPRNRPVSGREA